MIEAITRDDDSARFLGGSLDIKTKRLTLLRGDIRAVVVPFAIVVKLGDGIAADFTRLERLTIGLRSRERRSSDRLPKASEADQEIGVPGTRRLRMDLSATRSLGALAQSDYGRTIALGDYETSAGVVLYEIDPL